MRDGADDRMLRKAEDVGRRQQARMRREVAGPQKSRFTTHRSRKNCGNGITNERYVKASLGMKAKDYDVVSRSLRRGEEGPASGSTCWNQEVLNANVTAALLRCSGGRRQLLLHVACHVVLCCTLKRILSALSRDRGDDARHNCLLRLLLFLQVSTLLY